MILKSPIRSHSRFLQAGTVSAQAMLAHLHDEGEGRETGNRESDRVFSEVQYDSA